MNVLHFLPFLLGILLFLWIYPYPTARMLFIPIYILVAYLYSKNWRITLMTLAVIIILSVVLESFYSAKPLMSEGFDGDNKETKKETKKDDDNNLTTSKSIEMSSKGELTTGKHEDTFVDMDEIWDSMDKKTDGNVIQNIEFPNDPETEKVLGENEELKNLFKSMTFGKTDALEKIEKSKVKDKNDLTDEDFQAIVDDNQSVDEENSAELFTIKDDNGNTVTPASAQRDVFKMINTMKQLGTSIKAMAPTLVEARKVMDMLQRFDGEKKKN